MPFLRRVRTRALPRGSIVERGQFFVLDLRAEHGTYQYTGQDVGDPFSSLHLIAETGAYTVDGQTALLIRALRLDAAQGTYTVAGQDVNLARIFDLDAEHGVYTLSGQEANFLRDLALNAEQGTYAVTGQAATLARQIFLAAEWGIYSVSGQDAALRRSLILEAAQGAYAVSGQDVALLVDRIDLAADQGSYAVSGQDVGLIYAGSGNFFLDAEAGIYSVAGQDANFLRFLALLADQGSYAVSGQDAALNVARVLGAAQGSYSVSGQAAGFLGNALARAGTFTWTTAAAGNNISVTGLGFKPKVVFFFAGAPSTVDVVAEASYSMSIGFAVSSTERYCITGFAAGAVGTTDTARNMYNDAIAALWTNSTTMEALLDFVSMDDDGFTVAIDDATGTARSVGYLALGGSNLTNVKTGAISEPAATGDQDITGLGFQPDFVFAISNIHTAYNAIQNTRNLVMGWANAANQTVSATQDVHGNVAVATRSYQRLSEFLAQISTSAGVQSRASFSSFLSDGFRINWAERSSTGRLWPYVALKGLQTKIGTLNTRTDGNNIVVTGLGFAPKAVFFHGLSIPESAADTTDTSTWEKYSVGAASGPTQRFAIAHRQDAGSDPSDIARGIEHDEVYMEITTTAATLVSLMDLVSLDSDGFTCVMDDADAVARLVNYIAFG